MTLHSVPPESETTNRIARLERRLKRERSAREAAESIADRRMRELWLANQDLDRRVAERTTELEQALGQLEAATAAGAAFISNLSHEMLTPLNGIVGMLELLNETAHSDATRGYTTTALESSERLNRLLLRLLDLVELRAGRLVVAPTTVRLGDIREAIEADWRLPCLKAEQLLTVHLVGDADANLTIDARRVHQIVHELMENATAHGAPGVVSVDVLLHTGDQETDSTFELKVSDSGPGFVGLNSGDLWATFAKLDVSAGRATEGIGIGLLLSQQLARTLGGQLTVTTAPDTTTTCRLVLPVKVIA